NGLAARGRATPPADFRRPRRRPDHLQAPHQHRPPARGDGEPVRQKASRALANGVVMRHFLLVGLLIALPMIATEMTAVAFAQTKSQTGPASRPAAAPWDIVKGDGFALAVPRGWRKMDGISPRMIVFRQGDGIIVPT